MALRNTGRSQDLALTQKRRWYSRIKVCPVATFNVTVRQLQVVSARLSENVDR